MNPSVATPNPAPAWQGIIHRYRARLPVTHETPVVTLLLLDLVPDRRGMASSVQASLGSAVNGLVAGVLAPLAAACYLYEGQGH